MPIDPDDVADQALYLDDDNPDAIIAAALTISELVRRLNHATDHPTFGYPSQINVVVHALAKAAEGLPQLLGQLGDRLAEFADEPGLRVDWRGPGEDARDAQETAQLAAAYLSTAAVERAQWLAAILTDAGHYTDRLALDVDEEGDDD